MLTSDIIANFEQDVADSGTIVTAVGYHDDLRRIFTTSYHGTGTILRVYDTTNNVFTRVFEIAGRSILSTISKDNFQYFGYQDGSYKSLLHKLDISDNILRTVLISKVIPDMNSLSGSLITPSFSITDESSGRTISPTSISSSSLPTLNNISDVSYPLNYNNGSFVTVYASQGTNTDLEITTPWLAENNIIMTATMTDYYDGTASPIWVGANPNLKGINVNAPIITSDEETHNIGIQFTYSGYEYKQYNELVIHQCFLSNCEKCSYETRRSKWSSCRNGYALSIDKTRCEVEYLPVKPLSTTTQVFIAAGVGIGGTSSAATSATSTQGVWALINQYQLFLLLPFLQTYMPSDLEYYLTEFSLFSLDFDFLKFFKIPFLEDLAFDLDYGQKDETYKNNGFESGAFIVNHFNMFKALMVVFAFNLIFISCYYAWYKKRKSSKCKKINDWFKSFFYLTTYIRTIIEASQFAFMSALLESTTFSSAKDHPVSFLYSLGFVILMIWVPVFVYYYFKKNKEAVTESYYSEFYEGTKEKKSARLFIVVFFIRRFSTVMILVCLRSIHTIPRWLLFVFIQVINLVYVMKVKPFESNKDNIIEIMNENIFTWLCCFLSIFQDQSMWLGGMSAVIIIIIMSNGFLISFVIISDSIIGLIKYWKSKKKTRVEKIEINSINSRKSATERDVWKDNLEEW